VVLAGAILMTRGGQLIPGRAQNAFEAFYEFLSDFGIGLAGPSARPYIPIFVGAFLLVLFDNWVGLVPPVGKIELLRAPSSDVTSDASSPSASPAWSPSRSCPWASPCGAWAGGC